MSHLRTNSEPKSVLELTTASPYSKNSHFYPSIKLSSRDSANYRHSNQPTKMYFRDAATWCARNHRRSYRLTTSSFYVHESGIFQNDSTRLTSCLRDTTSFSYKVNCCHWNTSFGKQIWTLRRKQVRDGIYHKGTVETCLKYRTSMQEKGSDYFETILQLHARFKSVWDRGWTSFHEKCSEIYENLVTSKGFRP